MKHINVFHRIAAALLCLPLGARPFRLYLRRVGFFLLAGFLLGGVLFCLRCAYPAAGALPRRLFFAGLCLFCLLYELLLRQAYPRPQRAYALCFSLYGRRFCLRAFLDTGNGLCDAGGGSVIVVRREAVLSRLRPEEAAALLDPARAPLPVCAFPCATAAGEGVLPAFAPADLTLRDGTVCLPALLEPLGPGESRITVREGKYHQVRRMMASRNMTVTYLERRQEGALTLGNLPRGRSRELTEEEIAQLEEKPQP